jgi:hypothetical protein
MFTSGDPERFGKALERLVPGHGDVEVMGVSTSSG